MYFGKNLRYLRKLKNWSQEQIADKLGYKSFTTVQKWESSDSEPPISKVREICLLFNIPMDLILNLDLESSAPNILMKIRELKYSYNLQSGALTERLDIADVSYDEWLSGESESYIFYISEIADIFNVSVDFLVGKSKLFRSFDDGETVEIPVSSKPKNIIDRYYTKAEIDHIEKYRDLDSHGKEMVDFTLEKEWERVKEKEPELIMPTPEQVLEFINTPDKSIVADAAHSRTDIEVNEGTDTSEDNIMDEKNF